jgi:hypothetical protein
MKLEQPRSVWSAAQQATYELGRVDGGPVGGRSVSNLLGLPDREWGALRRIERFRDPILHTSDYNDARAFSGRSVLGDRDPQFRRRDCARPCREGRGSYTHVHGAPYLARRDPFRVPTSFCLAAGG